jgi:alpha-amylase
MSRRIKSDFLQMKKVLLSFLAFVLLFAASCSSTATPVVTQAAAPTPTAAPISEGTDGFPWWNDTVFYEIFVRSFRDSDGDGNGDFNGVIEKLDYLEDLGVKGIWLMPINPSPSYHGYDVTDYYAVNPDYGTMDDFKRLLEEAHKRDIRIIIDLVLNHTSAQHPWFKSALTPNSEYRDWYVWSETDPGYLGPWGAQAWHRASNGQYYYGIFWDQMPDLNYDTPAVREEAEKIASFWLDEVGVDGFRLDAARYLVEEEKFLADSPANHEFLAEWGQHYRSDEPDAFAVGEIWTGNSSVKKYVETDTELDSAFNFDLADALIKSVKDNNSTVVRFQLQSTIRDFPGQDNANFITNHDQNRVMSQFLEDEGKARVASAILLTAPGIPFLYYGEEIGMTGVKPDELIRTPMQWSDAEGAGFTDAIPWQAVNSEYQEVNVAEQTGDSTSLLEHYRRLIQLRNEHSALRVGQTYVAESASSKLVAYLRASSDETVLVLINIDDQPVRDYSISLGTGPLEGTYNTVSLLDPSTYNPLRSNAVGGFDDYVPIDELPPYSATILQLTQQ